MREHRLHRRVSPTYLYTPYRYVYYRTFTVECFNTMKTATEIYRLEINVLKNKKIIIIKAVFWRPIVVCVSSTASGRRMKTGQNFKKKRTGLAYYQGSGRNIRSRGAWLTAVTLDHARCRPIGGPRLHTPLHPQDHRLPAQAHKRRIWRQFTSRSTVYQTPRHDCVSLYRTAANVAHTQHSCR